MLVKPIHGQSNQNSEVDGGKNVDGSKKKFNSIQYNGGTAHHVMDTHITRKKQTHGTGERENTHTQPGAQSALDTPSAMDIRIPLIYRKKEKKKKRKNTWRDM